MAWPESVKCIFYAERLTLAEDYPVNRSLYILPCSHAYRARN